MTIESQTLVVTGEDPANGRLHDDPPLRPIEGPSAFGTDIRRFSALLWLTALQDFRLMYRTSLLGYVWTLMRPLSFFAVLYVVFTQIIRFGDTVPNYAVLLLLNIMLFQFFADATGSAMGSVVRGETVVRKMHFPRLVIPLAVVLTAAMTSAMNLVVVFGFMLASGIEPTVTWLFLPAILAALVAFSAATAVLLSTVYVWLRDLEHIWHVVLRVLFYATPILYPLELVPESFRWLVALNPLDADPLSGARLARPARHCTAHRGRRTGAVAWLARYRDRDPGLRPLDLRSPGAERCGGALIKDGKDAMQGDRARP